MTFSKAKIVILDDEPAMLHMLTQLLLTHGYQPYPASDSKQIYSLLKTAAPDLILMDILMPKINGFEVYEEIKAQTMAENIPIIFISALEGTANKVKAFNMGAVDYITKPFRVEELLARIQIHLHLRQVQQQLQAQNEQLEKAVKKRKKAKKALKSSERFMAGALDALAAHIAILDNNGIIMAVNAAWRNFGDKNGLTSVNYAIGANYLEVCEKANGDCAADALSVAEGIRAVILKKTVEFYLEYPCHSPHAARWFAVRVTCFENDNAIYAVVAHENMTERRLAEEIRNTSEANLKAILHNTQNLFVLIDKNHKVQAFNTISNEWAEQVFKPPIQANNSIYQHILPGEQADFERYYQAALQGNITMIDKKLHLKNELDSTYWLTFHYNPVIADNEQIIGVCLAIQDITERKYTEQILKQANELLFQLATLDSLTQIANRHQFNIYLNQQWQQALREQYCFSLILVDIDYFKNYNDYYGHQTGDDCLRRVAQSMRRTITDAIGLVARYGGEEFAIILPHVSLAQAQHQAEIVQKNIAALNIPHAKSKVSSIITLSLGIATTLPHVEYSAQQLLNQADQALYEAKAAGRNQIVTRQI